MVESQPFEIEDRADAVDAFPALQTLLMQSSLHEFHAENMRMHQMIDGENGFIAECRSGNGARLLDVDGAPLLVHAVIRVGDDGANEAVRREIRLVENLINLVRLAPGLQRGGMGGNQ